MILSLFLVLMFIAIFLIVISFWTRESVYSVIGFIFIFVLSTTILLSGNLQYSSGYSMQVLAPCDNNCTEVRQDGNISYAVVTNVVLTDTYDYFDDASSKWFGIWLSIISAIGFVIEMMNIKKFWGKNTDG